MVYDDVIRVEDLKTGGSRATRIPCRRTSLGCFRPVRIAELKVIRPDWFGLAAGFERTVGSIRTDLDHSFRSILLVV